MVDLIEKERERERLELEEIIKDNKRDFWKKIKAGVISASFAMRLNHSFVMLGGQPSFNPVWGDSYFMKF